MRQGCKTIEARKTLFFALQVGCDEQLLHEFGLYVFEYAHSANNETVRIKVWVHVKRINCAKNIKNSYAEQLGY